MKKRFLWVVALAVLPVAAWADGSQPAPVDLKSISVSLGAGSPAPAAPTPSPAAPRPTPPPVVPFEKLVPFLPEAPAGWTAEKSSGSVTDVEVFQLSTASRIYTKGDDQGAAVTTITLIDAGGHKGYFDATTGNWKTNIQAGDGYEKTVEIDGVPGFESFNRMTQSGSLALVVGKRFFVQIDVTNQEPAALREWLKKLDLKKLAELK